MYMDKVVNYVKSFHMWVFLKSGRFYCYIDNSEHFLFTKTDRKKYYILVYDNYCSTLRHQQKTKLMGSVYKLQTELN